MFDARQFSPEQGGIPAGWYNVIIKHSEAKAANSGNGGYLRLTLEIIDGEQKGREIGDNLNLWNQGEKAQQVIDIALRRLSSYCHVTGQYIIQNEEQPHELHGKPFRVQIGPQKGNETYSEVKAMQDITGNAPGKSGAAAPAPTGAQGGWGAQQVAAPLQPAPAATPALAANGWGQQQPQQQAAPAFAPQPAQNAAQGWGGAQPAAPAPQEQPQGAWGQQPAQGGWNQGQQPAQPPQGWRK